MGRLIVLGLLFLIPSSVGCAAASHAAPVTVLGTAAPAGGFDRPGDLRITDRFNGRVIGINSAHHLVFQYGLTNVVGRGFNEPSAPCAAFVVDDSTGRSVPPARFP